MKTTTQIRRALTTMTLAVLVTIGLTSSAVAQARPADPRRLDQIGQDLQMEISRVETQPATSSTARLRGQLEDMRDDLGYLRVMQRRGLRIEDREYRALETRLQAVRQAPRDTGPRTDYSRSGNGPAGNSRTLPRGSYEIPVGTEFDVRLQDELSSKTALVEDRFEATTVVDMYAEERVLIPAGSLLNGVISNVDRASRSDRRGGLTVTFDQITVNGRTYDIRANVVKALEAGVKSEVGKIGAGAGVGAIIGGLLGGTKGALAGILIGGGGTVLATAGNDVDLAVGTIMRVRIESPVQIDVRGR